MCDHVHAAQRAPLVIGGESVSPKKCEARGGHNNGLKDIWMLPDWILPGWECSWGWSPASAQSWAAVGATAAS